MKGFIMSYNTQCALRKIKLLEAKKNNGKRDQCSKSEYIALLGQLKVQYDHLVFLCTDENENYLMCQALLNSASIASEICDIESNKFENRELHILINRLLTATNGCYDLNLCRSAFVVIGRLYYCLGELTLSEEYIQKAFEDYDYSISTFRLYMQVLDKKKKFKEMLSLLKNYLSMSSGYHDKCSIEDFSVPNILHSPYALAYKNLFYKDI